MKVYYSSRGILTFIGDAKDESNAFDIVKRDLERLKIKSHYYNCHEVTIDNKFGLNVDYGSWEKFYFIEY